MTVNTVKGPSSTYLGRVIRYGRNDLLLALGIAFRKDYEFRRSGNILPR